MVIILNIRGFLNFRVYEFVKIDEIDEKGNSLYLSDWMGGNITNTYL